jgi:hypothetical protein
MSAFDPQQTYAMRSLIVRPATSLRWVWNYYWEQWYLPREGRTGDKRMIENSRTAWG